MKKSLVMKMLVYIAAGLSVGVSVFIVGYIVVMGVPNLNLDLFSWTYNSENVSLLPSLINTIIMVIAALAISIPCGVFSAIYMVEYARRGNKFLKIIDMAAETLSGIPSIIYGLFGMLLFVTQLKWGLTIGAGAVTLAIMVLPVIMRTTSEALKAVPDSFREGSFGLGAGRLRTVFKIILPSAMPGILSGVILACGRIVGETAALIYTAGTVASIPAINKLLTSSGRTLSVHMYLLSTEGLYLKQAYATAFVLLVFVVLLNALSSFVGRRLTKN